MAAFEMPSPSHTEYISKKILKHKYKISSISCHKFKIFKFSLYNDNKDNPDSEESSYDVGCHQVVADRFFGISMAAKLATRCRGFWEAMSHLFKSISRAASGQASSRNLPKGLSNTTCYLLLLGFKWEEKKTQPI